VGHQNSHRQRPDRACSERHITFNCLKR
jgi:hypothetical protein